MTAKITSTIVVVDPSQLKALIDATSRMVHT
jgi:hypothetical protein